MLFRGSGWLRAQEIADAWVDTLGDRLATRFTRFGGEVDDPLRVRLRRAHHHALRIGRQSAFTAQTARRTAGRRRANVHSQVSGAGGEVEFLGAASWSES